MTSAAAATQRRNKAFEETHLEMIETAVRLISEKGVEALSVSELARAMGVNRTTVYYHFDSREAMIAAVKTWSSEQLAKAFGPMGSTRERSDYIASFVLKNPELIKLWIEEFVSVGDIRDSYPHWDGLVEGMREAAVGEDAFDPEVFCVILLTSAIIGPRVFHNRVDPKESLQNVIRRFSREWQRLLQASGLPND